MRCFVGIPLPDDVRSALSQACDEMRSSDTGWRGEKWVPAENLHITLAFLGDVSDEQIAGLTSALGDALADNDRFELPFSGLHPAPNARRARMLWATYGDPKSECARVASRVAEVAAACGIDVEDRAFRAHVTLARARQPVRVGDEMTRVLAAASSHVPAFVSVRSATLFASTLSRTGAHYETLASWSFGS